MNDIRNIHPKAHRIFVIGHDASFGEAGMIAESERIRSMMFATNVPSAVGVGIGHHILRIPLSEGEGELSQAAEFLSDNGFTILDAWDVPPPGGGELIVDILDVREDATFSITVDERHFLASVMSDGGNGRRREYALSAFATGIGTPYGQTFESGDFREEDIMTAVTAWNETEARAWSPLSWDPNEPMLELSFRPQAEARPNGHLMDIHVDGVNAFWSMPVRLIPAGLDLDDASGADVLARLPAAPEKVRLWTDIAPFRLDICNPEILIGPADGPEPV